MDVLYFLIGCSVFVALIFLGAFIWANKTGQHQDTQTPAIRMLFDDELSIPSEKERKIPKEADQKKK
jgi:cbb3-type cytochrome oxidase maturation protein